MIFHTRTLHSARIYRCYMRYFGSQAYGRGERQSGPLLPVDRRQQIARGARGCVRVPASAPEEPRIRRECHHWYAPVQLNNLLQVL